jgi:hypothetical protein
MTTGTTAGVPPTITQETSDTADIDGEIRRLVDAPAHELRREWHRLYRAEPPARLSRDLLLRAVAYKLQERHLGGLSAAATRRLRELARKIEAEGHRALGLPDTIKPGARLVRDWRGQTYMVTVLEEGFDYDGRHYRSLSEIAKAITGGHRSGPRFFGLNAPDRKTGHGQA